MVALKGLASASWAYFWRGGGAGIMSKTGILHRRGHISLQTPCKEHILDSQASMMGKTNWKGLQIALIKALQRNNFLFFFGLGFFFFYSEKDLQDEGTCEAS